MSPADLVAERRAELARRLAALTPEMRAQLARSRVELDRKDRRGQIQPRAAGAPVPMSFAQELLWLLDRANPGMHGYNVPRSSRVRGALDLDALQSALDAIVERHEVLRSTFDMIEGEPRQIVHAPAPVALSVVDLRDRPAERREQDALAMVRELTRRPFDLTADSQLRASLLRLDEDDHVLLLESHHVAADGWSRNILMRELSELYESQRRGVAPNLEPLPIQYGDYAQWQRDTLQGETLERHLAFWRDQLRDAPALLELPTDRPRPLAPSFEGATRSRMLPVALMERLRQLSRDKGATLFVTLLAAFDVLLARLGGQHDVVVGSPTAGRSHEATEGLIGYFINMVVLRTKLDGDPTFAELVARVRETTLSAFEHQDVPYEKLALEMQRDREVARGGLFQVMFTLQDSEIRTLQLPGLTFENFGTGRGATKFDLSLFMHEQKAGLRATIEYRTDLFDAATIDRMLVQLENLLDAVSDEPDTPISALPLLMEGERELLLHEWAGPSRDYPADTAIHALIEAQVDRTPDALALTFDGASLSYGEMDARANRLARLLRERGVQSGDFVGVCLERSFEMVIGLLAILKAGAAYVPLDPEYPRERLAFMLEDCAPTVTLTRIAERAALPPEADSVLVLDDPAIEARLSAMSPARLDEPVPGDALAYAIYTSGSTGRPKGAPNRHAGVVNRLLWARDTFGFDAGATLVQKTPYSFDVSVQELFCPLLAGSRLVIAAPGGHRDPAYLQELIERERITAIHFVPSMLGAFLAYAEPERLRSLRTLMCSGEALAPATVVRAYQVLPDDATVHNLYGPTECAVDVTHWACPRDPAPAVMSIGRPVANTRCYVLDEAQQLVPVGVPGELYLAGRQVGAGYLRRPELTAERFVADPFADPVQEPGARMYRTGDRARWTADGTIEYLGRLDFQVKLRGFRIELGEIEAVIAAEADVAEALATVREVVPGDSQIVCYFVPVAGVKPDHERLRAAMSRVLPSSMIPSAIVELDAFPLTSSGKINRQALPMPQTASLRTARYWAPRTTIEHEMVQIWEKLLDRRPIGIRDDFFELGGHSLLAVRMLAEVGRYRGRSIPLAWLFESSTIEALVARIDSDLHATAEPPLVALQANAPGTPIAFVHGDGHGGGWYCRRLAPLIAPDSPMYVLPTLGSDTDEHTWSIETMAERHVAELRKVQPHGPYRLAGFCVGGLVALEMALQLRAAGEAVERLIIIDSAAVNARLWFVRPLLALVTGDARTRQVRQANLMRRLRRYYVKLRKVIELDASRQYQWTKQNVERRWDRLAQLTGFADAPVGVVRPERRAAPGDPVMRFQERAGVVYIPRRFDGRIDLIHSEVNPGTKRRDPTRDFYRVATEVNVHPILTQHIGLITNDLPMMAEVIHEILEPRSDG
jgi:amino acid adenylation domain-containing protein